MGSRCYNGPTWGSKSLPKVVACIQVLIHPSNYKTDLVIPTIKIGISKYNKTPILYLGGRHPTWAHGGVH